MAPGCVMASGSSIQDILLSDRASARGYFKRAEVERLLTANV